MTTQQTRSGVSRSADEDRSATLRLILKLDAVATGAVGILSLAASPVLDDLLGTPMTLLRPIGLFLIVYAAFVWIVGTRQRVSRPAVWTAILINLLWAVDSVVVVAAGWFPLTALGIAFVFVQGAVVALFAAAQLYALRKSS
jgi:hypothetical protein